MEGSSHCGWSPTTLAARHGTTANGRANRRRKVFCMKKHPWKIVDSFTPKCEIL